MFNKSPKILLFSLSIILVFFVGLLSYLIYTNITSPDKFLNPSQFNLPETAKEVIEKRTESTATFEISTGKYATVSIIGTGYTKKNLICEKTKYPFFCQIFSWLKKFFPIKFLAVLSGPNSPSTIVNNTSIGNVSWISPGNAVSSNDVRATAGIVSGDPSNYLLATAFGFSIPAGATIDGIIVEWEKRNIDVGINDIADNAIRIVKGGTIGTTDKSSLDNWTVADAYKSYGSSSDLWGLSWTVAEINATGFGAALSAQSLGALTADAEVDHVRITVYYTAETTPPTITNISSDKANGTYTIGEVIDIDVTFSEVVTSTGNVTVTLETGAVDRTCTFAVSSSTTGTCNYTVQSGDTTSDLTVNTISGTIADAASNAMTDFAPATNLAANKALVIDTTAPTITTLSPADNATGVSTTANLVLTFDETVTAVAAKNLTIKKTSDDSTVETISITGVLVSGSGSTTITIDPTTTLANSTSYYVIIDSGAFIDTAINSYAGISSTTEWNFTTSGGGGGGGGDNTSPTITNITSDKANGTYTIGEVIDIDVTFSEVVTSTGNVTVTLETGAIDRTCTFTVSSASTGTCNYIVQAGDTSSDLTVKIISGTIKDAAHNDMTNFVPATNLAANKALVIDTPPPAPINLIATAGNTQVSLTWDAVSGAISYTVKRGTVSGSEVALPAGTGITQTSFIDTAVINGTLYFYVVTVTNIGGTSQNSNRVSVKPQEPPPPPPINLVATAGNLRVSLIWNAVSGAISYTVKRGTVSGSEVAMLSGKEITQTSFINTTVTNGITYFYVVTATNAGGTSPNSNRVSATPQELPPPPPPPVEEPPPPPPPPVEEPPPPPPVEETSPPPSPSPPNDFIIIVGELKRIIETPQGSVITKTISTIGVTSGVVATVAAVSSSFSFSDIFLSLIRLIGGVLTGLGIRKRIKHWGTAYDSVTKQPLDPVYITLTDLQGKDIASAITDIDGRYGLSVESGSYKITANKTNYAFPSKKLIGKTQDELYNDLYFGETIEINKTGEVLTKNIPMDSVKFDWNEFAKKDKTFMKFYSKWDLWLRKVSDFSFVIGFVVSIVVLFFAPRPYNIIIFVLYLILLLMRILGLKPKSFGYIIDKITGMPLSFAILRIMMPSTNIEISHKITDAYGRYYCLLPKGKYYVKIEKKNDDASYSLIHTSEIIDASKNGIIKEKFKV